MQFEKRKRLKLNENAEDTCPYPYWINFYNNPPSYKVTMQEIEDVATERLHILQVIDNLVKTKENTKRSKQYLEVVLSQLNGLKHNNDKNFFVAGRSHQLSPKVFEARKRDHISHFLLRIYYCKNQELQKWFISSETEMFRIRLMDLSLTDSSILQDCLTYYGYNYEIVSTDERVDLHEKINWTEINKTYWASTAFKLNFEDALDLVRTRKIYLNQGYGYIPAFEMVSVLCKIFRSNLSKELSRMRAYFESLDEQRLVSRLDSLHNTFIATSFKKPNEDKEYRENQLSVEQIDAFSKELFPPCMRSIHETLRRDHHLKHYGRLHYGLFLKAAGLSLEDAIDFFRSEMSIHNPEKFQKEYAYTIRYIYGKEGKRVQLSAYSCQKIINGSAPGPTDTHGCPFKHFDTKNLRALLIRYGVNDESSLDEIIKMASEDSNISGACSKFFTVKYGRSPKSESVYHPNQFFREARQLFYAPQLPAMDESMGEHSFNESFNHNNASVAAETTIDSMDASLMDFTDDKDFEDIQV